MKEIVSTVRSGSFGGARVPSATARREFGRTPSALGRGVLATVLLLGALGTPAPEADASATISQVGGDIDGEAAGDRSGSSVSLSSDGSRVAIGAPENDGAGSDAGHVRVYDWNGSAWVQVGGDIDGEAAEDRSGSSVSLSSDGSRVAIGAPDNDGAGGNAGHVRVYDWNGSAWVQVGGDIDAEAARDSFGGSVSLSSDGSRVAIGATFNSGTATFAGHVRVYDFDGSAWVQVGGDIDGEAIFDVSGYSVSLSSDGSLVAIGAPGNDGAGSDAGHVRVYGFDGSAWVQVGGDIDGEAAEDRSGSSVSLSSDGSRVAIGAPRYDPSGKADAGHVRVYDWNGSAWVQVGGDIDGEAADDRSGRRVSLSSDGSRVAIGASENDGAGSNAGHVRVFSISIASEVVLDALSRLAVSCGPGVPSAGMLVTCTVTEGDPGIDILWRAAYNPVFAEAGVTLDTSGAGEFSFIVPAEAVGQELTVELVEWHAPVSLGVAGGPVPTSVPSGGGPVPVWSLVVLALAGGLLLRRVSTVGVRD
jgi:hypothetical protein